ncbi:MAG TPA: hypothetical protein VGG31_02945 [Candidatus Dormibacteraeota bacterium]|jgi:hypothetical protein
MGARRNWLLIGPLALMAVGLAGEILSSQNGWQLPRALAVVAPNLLLALLIAGAIAWLATGRKKREGS